MTRIGHLTSYMYLSTLRYRYLWWKKGRRRSGTCQRYRYWGMLFELLWPSIWTRKDITARFHYGWGLRITR